MDVSALGQRRWLALAGVALAIGCAPRPDTTVVHLTEPAAPIAASSAEPLPELPPAPPPTLSPRPAPALDDGGLDVQEADRARARELFEQGAEAYAQGDFPKARQAFQAAYDLVPERALLFNIASAELRMRDLVSACAHFRAYVAGGDASDPRVQQVQSQVATRCGHVP